MINNLIEKEVIDKKLGYRHTSARNKNCVILETRKKKKKNKSYVYTHIHEKLDVQKRKRVAHGKSRYPANKITSSLMIFPPSFSSITTITPNRHHHRRSHFHPISPGPNLGLSPSSICAASSSARWTSESVVLKLLGCGSERPFLLLRDLELSLLFLELLEDGAAGVVTAGGVVAAAAAATGDVVAGVVVVDGDVATTDAERYGL
jgi:hypothetical protein